VSWIRVCIPGCILALLACAAHAQNPQPLSPGEELEADIRDNIVLQTAMTQEYSAEDIYLSSAVQDIVEKEADEMVKAAHRRIDRKQKELEEMQALVAAGKASPDTLQPIFKEIQKRIETAYLATSTASILKDIVNAARIEELNARRHHGRGAILVRYAGNGKFNPSDMEIVSAAFRKRFHHSMPISAEGATRTHRSMGFDHRGRVDVALHPDQLEGAWLCRYLQTLHIPYYAFRRAIVGSATGPHIHIGPGSMRIARS